MRSDAKCSELIKPYLRGQDIKRWTPDWNGLWLLAIPSSADRDWPWSVSGEFAEDSFAATYPSVYAHLSCFREALIRRQDQGRYWWEMRSCAYWDAFEKEKIIWPDIAKVPRFCRDSNRMTMGNTGYFVVSDDNYLLGILSSWAIWFLISKTCQPLRLRGDRWQYRLFTQFMEVLPVPDPRNGERQHISALASACSDCGIQLFDLQGSVRNRLVKVFGEQQDGKVVGNLNNKAARWSELTLMQLGTAIKSSFKLERNPFQNPKVAEEWDGYIAERKQKVDQLSRQLNDAEAELNDRVYRLFHLNDDEIKLLKREVEH